MSVTIETSLGTIRIKLYFNKYPLICYNLIRLADVDFYKKSLIHKIEKNKMIYSGLHSEAKNFDVPGPIFSSIIDVDQLINSEEIEKASNNGPFIEEDLVSETFMDTTGLMGAYSPKDGKYGSHFFIIINNIDVSHIKDKVIFGKLEYNLEFFDKINQVEVDEKGCPINPLYIYKIILSDEIKRKRELFIIKSLAEAESKARLLTLKLLNDVDDINAKTSDDTLFICKLNPVTEADDLKVIFSRFGKVTDCNVVKDWKTGDSLQYGFITFQNKSDAETAYKAMQNSVIDKRRVIVSFCQSSKKFNKRIRKK